MIRPYMEGLSISPTLLAHQMPAHHGQRNRLFSALSGQEPGFLDAETEEALYDDALCNPRRRE